MFRAIFCLLLIFFVSLKTFANQIDDVPRIIEQIDYACKDKNSSYQILRNLYNQIDLLEKKQAEILFERLIEQLESLGNEEKNYCINLMASVYFYNKQDYALSLKYISEAEKFSHQSFHGLYLDFLKALNFEKQNKVELSHQFFAKVYNQTDQKTILIRVECLKYLAEHFSNYHDEASSSKFFKQYLQVYDLLDKNSINNNYLLLPNDLHLKYSNKQANVSSLEAKPKDNQNLINTFALVFLGGVFFAGVSFAFSYRKKVNLLKTINHSYNLKNKELEKNASQLALLGTLVSSSANAMYIVKSNGDIDWVNKNFEKLYNVNKKQYILTYGKNVFFSSNEEKIKAFCTCREKKSPTSFETRISHLGNERWIKSDVSPLFDTENNIKEYLVIDTDITKIKASEKLAKQNLNEIITSKSQIEKDNEHLTASLRNAQLLQQYILPSQEDLNQHFENFIIYNPKDIVSGDFYWYYYDSNQDSHFFAVGDCTGHGVRGGFMSVICKCMLDEIIKERHINSPKNILELLEEKIVRTLKQNENNNTDGLDISLVKIKKQDEKYNLVFSGAKSLFYTFDRKNNILQRIKPTKKSIGGVNLSDCQFEEQSFNLSKDDCIYFSSDGIISQNNNSRRNFTSTRFENMLYFISEQSMENQKNHILDKINEFKEDSLQRDDICIVGIKL